MLNGVENTEKITKRRAKKVVSSKIEITAPTLLSKSKSDGIMKYRNGVRVIGEKILAYALELCPENLLTVKIGLMEAVREVEIKMRERDEG